MDDLPKVFDHASVDKKWYDFWERIGAFQANPNSKRRPFSMVLPPPNVTGWLHIGHALNQTLPDIVARWRRMQGFDVLWLPGTDHAGIATQNVVEKQLLAQGMAREDLGRKAFEARVWDWATESRKTITGQMRMLGSSVDWSRERFTLEKNLSTAVRRVFVSLYDEGLIYCGKYMVSWCPRCRTALSDLEVEHKETNGRLYYIRYPYATGKGSVTVATTRPETMLGDTGVAVQPKDKRYCALVGQWVRLPVVNRELRIIADEFVDPEFGTGAVKVTPAHDPNDFAMGQRHGLTQVSVIDEDGRMTKEAGPYAGQDRFEARVGLVEQLDREGLLARVEEHRHAVGHCQRCGTIIEPLVSQQWFIKIGPLAEPAIQLVKEGRIQFFPENWTKTYFEWMTNVHDWCISRQLWWGHRIPAWYCDVCGEMYVQEVAPQRCACGEALRQETDVLDTWFSSGLWPFSTMGWPEPTVDLARYYPTNLLITAHDIIFFWVARMIMLGIKFGGDVPFEKVYITSLVRDEHGQKMSKSKGNVINPLELMEEIGADGFRFTLAALASPGVDISLSEGRLRGYRQFINKIWNASRFVLMNLPEVIERQLSEFPPEQLELCHRWILHRVSEVAGDVEDALEGFRFDVATDRLFHFFWHEYADWYIELVKPHLQEPGEIRDTSRAVLFEVHDRVLRMLHPFIPFITEEIWQKLPQETEAGRTADGKHQTIALALFPMKEPAWTDTNAAVTMKLLQELITAIRTVRAERGVRPSSRIHVVIEGADDCEQALLTEHGEYVRRLAGLDSFKFSASVPRSSETVTRVVKNMQVHVPLAGIVERGAEINRIERELKKLARQRGALEGKLANAAFRTRADPKVVQDTEAQAYSLTLRQTKLEKLLQELSG